MKPVDKPVQRDREWEAWQAVLHGEPEFAGDPSTPTKLLVRACITRLRATVNDLRGKDMQDRLYDELDKRCRLAEKELARVTLENRQLQSAADVARQDALATLKKVQQLLTDCLPKSEVPLGKALSGPPGGHFLVDPKAKDKS